MIGGRGRRKRSGVILRKENGRTQQKNNLLRKTVEQKRRKIRTTKTVEEKLCSSENSREDNFKTDTVLSYQTVL